MAEEYVFLNRYDFGLKVIYDGNKKIPVLPKLEELSEEFKRFIGKERVKNDLS